MIASPLIRKTGDKETCRPGPGEAVCGPADEGDRGDLGDPDAEVRALRILPEGEHAMVSYETV